MYSFSTLIGAPPQDAAKYDGDQRTPFQYFFIRSGLSCRSNRLDTPLSELTRDDIECLGGYFSNRWTWLFSPSISTSSVSKSLQTFEKMARRRSIDRKSTRL